MSCNPINQSHFINFLQYRLPFQDALQVGGNTIERVSSYKLLGVYLNNDLSWNLHCDYITKKANKRLYILRIVYYGEQGLGINNL